jgi:CubicO group peptidase (beta-lactamase class C family)
MKIIFRFFLLVLLLFTKAPIVQAKPLTKAQGETIDASLRLEMEKQRVAGLAIGIIRNGEIVYLNGYGWADAENKVPVGPKTMFRWASISKTLTAVSAMQLAEKKLLDLDADVRNYVPEFPDKGTVITSRQLLSHQSGLPHYDKWKVKLSTNQTLQEHPFADVVTALDTFKDAPLLFTPGDKYSYSTFGYMLLSAVVERAGKQKFADQIKERVIQPLRLTTLQPDYQWVPIEGRAVGYRMKGMDVVPSKDTDVSWKLGGGGYISNIEDITRYAQGLIQAKLLSVPTFATMWQPQQTNKGETTSMSFGFGAQIEANNRLKVWHNGLQEKSSCRLVLYPREGLGVVVMSNSEYAEPGKFTTAVLAALTHLTQ